MVAYLTLNPKRFTDAAERWINLVEEPNEFEAFRSRQWTRRAVQVLDRELSLERKLLLGMHFDISEWTLPVFVALVLDFGMTSWRSRPIHCSQSIDQLDKAWDKIDIARHLVLEHRCTAIAAKQAIFCEHTSTLLEALKWLNEARDMYLDQLHEHARAIGLSDFACQRCKTLTEAFLCEILPSHSEELGIIENVWRLCTYLSHCFSSTHVAAAQRMYQRSSWR